jgi:tetratricopeptide (TPR) repeat protein
MLGIEALNADNNIETKHKATNIVVGEDGNLSISIDLPSAGELIESHCTPIPQLSIKEVCSLDPFNFTELINSELSNLKKKFSRFKDSPTFISKFAGLTTLSGDLDSSEKILSENVSETSNPFLMQALGNVCVLKGDYNKAVEVFSRHELSDDVFSRLRLAYLKSKSNEFPEAQKHLEKAIELDPTDYRSRMFSGAMHLQNGECEKAIRDFRVASEQKDDSSALHVNLAVSHWSLGHTEKAIRELKKAVRINPLNENAIIFYSDALFVLKEYEKSISHLEFFTQFDEKSEFVWERLARSYYFSKKYTKSKLALEKQASLGSSSSIWNNLGLVHWKLKDGIKAISNLNKSIKMAEKEKDAAKISYPVLNLAGILNEINRNDDCIDFVNGFNAIDSTEVNEEIRTKIYIQVLIALEATSNYKAFTKKINELVNNYEYKNVENIVVLYIYKIYSDTVIEGNFELVKESIDCLLRIVGQNRDHPLSKEIKMFIYNNICFSLLYFNQTKEAEKFIPYISNYVHEDPYCTATLGLYKIRKGDLANGQKLYTEAISIEKKQKLKPKIRQRMFLELSKHFLSKGDHAQAKKNLNKALKEKYGHNYAIEEAKRLLTALPQL